jgi:cytochrome c oxidase cbb3-type subunit 3
MAKYQENPMENHEADGIQEFDNNLPRWWLYGFYFTMIFAVAYMIQYHVLADGKVSANEYKQELAEAKIKYKLDDSKTVKAGRTLVAFTDATNLEAGKKLFTGANLCYTCHREDLGGLVGPNLTDDKWMHGCSLDSIVASIEHGYPEKGMLPYGNNTKLSDEQVLQIASFVLSKRGTNPPNPKPVDPAEQDCK